MLLDAIGFGCTFAFVGSVPIPTVQFGKCHETPAWGTGISGTFDRCPSTLDSTSSTAFPLPETNRWNPVFIDGSARETRCSQRRKLSHLPLRAFVQQWLTPGDLSLNYCWEGYERFFDKA